MSSSSPSNHDSPNDSSNRRRGNIRRDIGNPELLIERLATVERSLHSLRSENEQSSQLATLGLMSATLAHELRNLLTPALGYAQLAQNRPHDAALQAKAIDRIVDSLTNASELIHSTLDFTHQPGESGAASIESANVSRVAEQALQLLGGDVASQGIQIDCNIRDSFAVQIRELALQQVFMNLILNASRALREPENGACDQPRITIRAEHQPQQDMMTISVADNGPGLPDGWSNDKLFAVFKTTATADQDAHDARLPCGGTGLGLAICKTLIEEAGGRIAAESSPDNGAVFLLHLPVAKSVLKKAC